MIDDGRRRYEILYTAARAYAVTSLGEETVLAMEAKEMTMEHETAQTLLSLLNPLHGAIDDQTSDDVTRAELDLPKDYEHNVAITPQMSSDLTKAILILEGMPSMVVERAQKYFWEKATQYDREKLQATYNDLLELQGQTDQVPLATALDAVGGALAMTQFQQMHQNTTPSVEKIEELKRSGHDDMQITMYIRGFREARNAEPSFTKDKPISDATYGAQMPSFKPAAVSRS